MLLDKKLFKAFLEKAINEMKDENIDGIRYANLDKNYLVMLKFVNGFDENNSEVISNKVYENYELMVGIFVRSSSYYIKDSLLPRYENGELFDEFYVVNKNNINQTIEFVYDTYENLLDEVDLIDKKAGIVRKKVIKKGGRKL